MYTQQVAYICRNIVTMATAASRVDELINYFKSHNKIREQQSHSAKVHSVGWSCDGKYLASGSFDKSVCIFSLCPDRLVSKRRAVCKRDKLL